MKIEILNKGAVFVSQMFNIRSNTLMVCIEELFGANLNIGYGCPYRIKIMLVLRESKTVKDEERIIKNAN